jgi:hypothetical protein
MQKQELQLRVYLPDHFFVLVALEQLLLMLLDIQFKFDSIQLSSWETSVVIWTAAVMAYVLLSPDDSLPPRTAFWQSVSARVSSAHY